MQKDRTSARNSPRVEVGLPARLDSPTSGAGTISVTTRDLGAGGALCESPVPLPEGAEVTFRIVLPGERSGPGLPLAIPAIITRVEGGQGYVLALQFADLPASVLDPLKRFLFRALGGR